ncbi:agmatine deiminase [Chromobacterium phragmitis]|uniref:Agmatine deiminase n=1 Tax=Chromobacterium phragmitis TaxID=2202141 RepID=A0A344UFC0_9NEIS|nr:agmatine deiminase family protein [Chromobacterium phragmitis]AXE28644.1 agmatine deiminase [Chromobacterium phragmitis]AXE33968.1 agmatine deiminase [Chromobacterium phragmitis]
MANRRQFLGGGAWAAASLLAGKALAGGVGATPSAGAAYRMPDEGDRHAATWMAFGPSLAVWGESLLPAVRRDLARVAATIAAFEPVRMLARENELEMAAKLCGPGVELIAQPLDDLWIRDSGPVFVRSDAGRMAAVDFNFNGWGGKQAHGRDAKVAGFVAAKAGTPPLRSRLVLEGGGIEVDGEGTAIITESCVLNPNRNPGWSKERCEQELRRALGVEKVIWLPGIAGRDITDGHTDFYARFAAPGIVAAGLEADPDSYDYSLTRRHLAILRQARDARGRKLEVVAIPGPTQVRPAHGSDEMAAGYINFYVCNGAVIAPEFGDARADRNALSALRELFPGREVAQLNIDAIAAGGGGIHCATQQQPA